MDIIGAMELNPTLLAHLVLWCHQCHSVTMATIVLNTQMTPRSKFLLFCVNLSELLSIAVVKHRDQGNF